MTAEAVFTIEVRPKSVLSPRETARLEGLTLGGRGTMMRAFRAAEPTQPLVLAVTDRAVVGWSLPSIERNGAKILNVYVHPRARRRGVGRALLARAREVFHLSQGRAHDAASRRFFAA